jgi:hypothetical protein
MAQVADVRQRRCCVVGFPSPRATYAVATELSVV